MKKQIYALTGLLLSSFFLPARAAEMVKDLNPGVTVFDPSHVPFPQFVSYTPVRGGRAIFVSLLATEEVVERVPECGLWVTDGTAEGTEQLAELCGEADSLDEALNVRVLATNGSVALFTDRHGRIWRTDGTAAGTFPLGNLTDQGEILVGSDGRTFFFTGCTRPFGCEPWKSDGTREGTVMIRDLRPGRKGSDPGLFTRDRGRVLFVTNIGSSGSIWATNGTAAGTVELARLPRPGLERILPHGRQVFFTIYGGNAEVWVTGPKPGRPVLIQSLPSAHWRYSGLEIAQAGGRVFITRLDVEDGTTTLWETDGTSRGTRRLAVFAAGLSQLFTVGGRAVFAASREEGRLPQLWYLSREMKSPRRLGGPGILGQRLIQLGNRLFFIGTNSQQVSSLWTTDGSRGGTRFVQALCSGACEPGGSFLLRTALGRLFFTDAESRLWMADGSGEETVLLARVPPLGVDGLVDLAPLAGGRIVFSGFDEREGIQPWVSDLTPGGADRILPLGTPLAAGSQIWGLSRFGDKVLFSGCDGESSGLFVSDGTETGTFLLAGTETSLEEPCPLDFFVVKITVLGNVALFDANGKLWRTDGTPGGTFPVLTLDVPFVRASAKLGDKLLFVLDPVNLSERVWRFWTSDGTEAGTRQAFELRLGGTPNGFVSVGGEVFFIAQSAESPFPYTLWRTDGTEAGTRKLVAVNYPTSGIPIEAVRFGGKTILALGGAGRPPSELWVTDGTAAGTVPLFADPEAPGPKNPFGLTVFKDAVWFFTGTGDPSDGLGEPFALWRSDGTAAGTRLVKTLSPPRTDYGFLAPLLTPVGDTLFFRADDGVHGSELWKTDGTAEGTVLVADVAPGAANAHPSAFAAFDGKLWFAATDGVHGLELWVSDGTAAGTRLVEDIFPGPSPSAPEQLTAVAGKLFFAANDGVHGRELWVETSPH